MPQRARNAQTVEGSTFSPLRYRLFRAIWLGNVASSLGSLIQVVGASWLMTVMSHSALMVSLVQGANAIPIVVLSLVGGSIADNYDRRAVMLASQGFMLTISLLFTALTVVGWMTPWLLLGGTVLLGCGAAFSTPAWHASVGLMVPRSELRGAVTLNTMGFNLARAVGPAIGGAVVGAFGAMAAFGINTVSYLVPTLVILGWKPAPAVRRWPPEPIVQALEAGIRYVTRSPDLLVVLLRAAMFGLASSALSGLMPLIARDLIGGGPSVYGAMFTTFGVGAVVGGFGGSRLRRVLSNEGIVRSACVAFAVAVAGAALSKSLIATCLCLFVSGNATILVLTGLNATVQLVSPQWVLARSLAIYRMALFGGLALGSWTWGAVAQWGGIALALVLSALGLLLCGLAGLAAALPEGRDHDLDPLDDWTEPVRPAGLAANAGPVVIEIAYRIREQDADAFVAAMSERRRIRERDGAGSWALIHDLQDSELWTERYRVAGWTEYVRHSHRVTKQDAAVLAHVDRLHQGPVSPALRWSLERRTARTPRSG